jgi:succinyl-diaminopimelate desuccinylase
VLAVLAVLASVARVNGLKAKTSRRVVDLIRRQQPIVEKRWGRGTGRMADRLTTSIGTVRGGGQVNLIPAACEAEVDFRLPPGMTTRAVETLITKRIKGLRLEGVGLEVFNRCDPYVTSPTEKLVTALVTNGRDVIGQVPLPVVRLGYTDGRLFRRAGIPTAVYGPRVYRMGGSDEYVEQEEVLQVAQVHAGTILDYLGAT